MNAKHLIVSFLCVFGLFFSACNDALKDQIAELKSEIEALKNGEVNSIGEQVNKIQATVSGLENTSSSLKQSLETLSNSNEEVKELFLESSSRIDSLVDASFSLKQSIGGLSESQDEAKKLLLENRSKIEALADASTSLKQSLEALSGSHNEAKELLFENSSKINVLVDASSSLKQSLDLLSGSTEETKKLMFENNSRIEALVEASSSIKQSLENLTGSHDKTKELLFESSSKIDALVNALIAYSDSISQSQKNWTRATFSTLAYQSETEKILSSLRIIFNSVDTNIATQIKRNEESVRSWVGETLTGYYTCAEAQSVLEKVKKESNNEITSTLEKTREELVAEYQAAIIAAITENEGKITAAHKASIDEINTKINDLSIKIDALAERVEKLEKRITSINYVKDEIRDELNIEKVTSTITNEKITINVSCEAPLLVFKTNGHVNISTTEAKIAYTCPAVMDSWGDLLYSEVNIDKILEQEDGDVLFVSWEKDISYELLLDSLIDFRKLSYINFSLVLKTKDGIISSDYNRLKGFYNIQLDYRQLEDMLSDFSLYLQEESIFEGTTFASFVNCYNEAECFFTTQKAENQEAIENMARKLFLRKTQLYPRAELIANSKGVNKGYGWAILYDGGPKWAVNNSGVSLWKDKQIFIDAWNDSEFPGAEWRLPSNSELEKLCDPNLVYWEYDYSRQSIKVYRRHIYDNGQTLFRTGFSYDDSMPHIVIDKEYNYEFSSDYTLDESTGLELPYFLLHWNENVSIWQTSINEEYHDPSRLWGAVRLVCE